MPQQILWELDGELIPQINQLLVNLVDAQNRHDSMTVDSLKDRLKSFPGYPMNMRPEDTVNIVRKKIITIYN